MPKPTSYAYVARCIGIPIAIAIALPAEESHKSELGCMPLVNTPPHPSYTVQKYSTYDIQMVATRPILEVGTCKFNYGGMVWSPTLAVRLAPWLAVFRELEVGSQQKQMQGEKSAVGTAVVGPTHENHLLSCFQVPLTKV